jgi:hypothetical protein
VARLLKAEGYSLQGNAKVAEGAQHPDRDAQFRYIAGRAREFLDAGQPVVSVDAKKKEKVGEFANGGAEWRPAGRPERVNVHDFPSDAIGKAIPYGIYDLGANAGWVSVGTDHDTSAFAVAMLRRWWRADGSARYPAARRLLICADSGGSNAARARAWKVELARLAAETGLEVTVCHYPPGTRRRRVHGACYAGCVPEHPESAGRYGWGPRTAVPGTGESGTEGFVPAGSGSCTGLYVAVREIDGDGPARTYIWRTASPG